MSMTPPTIARHDVIEAARIYHAERARHEAGIEAARRARDDEIRAAIDGGMSQADAARATGLSRQRISQIANAPDSPPETEKAPANRPRPHPGRLPTRIGV